MELNKILELIGWIFFVISAIGFIIQNKTKSFWGMFASIAFLLGCVFFLSTFLNLRSIK